MAFNHLNKVTTWGDPPSIDRSFLGVEKMGRTCHGETCHIDLHPMMGLLSWEDLCEFGACTRNSLSGMPSNTGT